MTTATCRRPTGGHDDLSMNMIDEFADHLAELRRADRTIGTYIDALRQADAALPEGLVCASETELRAWLRTPGWGKATVALRTAILRTFFNWACDPHRTPHLDYNPTMYLPSVKRPRRYPRPAPTEVLTAAIEGLKGDHRLCVIVAAYAGARCCEIAALNREDITVESTVLHGKGDASRVVPTHAAVWAEVRERPAGPLLRDAAGRRLSARQVSRKMNGALDRLGYPGVTAHQFRHWFGTKANDAVGDLAAVQELLGHASPNTTRIYVQPNRRAMAAAVAGLPDLTG